MGPIGNATVIKPTVPARAQASAPAGLSEAIDKVVASDPKLQNAHWGLTIADKSGKVVYQHDADKLFTPASNMKMVTAATASTVLGPQSTFKTTLASDGTVDADGTLHGNLYLVGGGDPSLQTADLKAAADSLHIKKVDGNLIVDDHAFDSTRIGRGWASDDLSANYGAEIDGLTVDEGTAEVRVDGNGATVDPGIGYLQVQDHANPGAATSLDVERTLGENTVTIDGTLAAGDHRDVAVTVHDPALYAGTLLRSLCNDDGIEFAGQLERGVAPDGSTNLWQKTSAPLIQLEKHMLKESDNLYAETLFRALANGQSAQAPDKERATLHITTPNVIVDGSGLSRMDLLSPNLLDGVVQHDYADPAMRDCLPVAGVDGTLKHRMPALAGRLEAKTGTETGVSSLSGWLTAKNGHDYSFSWMCNDYAGPGVKATEDRLMTAIDANLSGH